MNFEKRFEKQPYKTGLGISIKTFFVVLLFLVIVGTVGFFLNPFRQASRMVSKTIDADNVIYNYEWFKQQYQDVLAIDKKIIQQAESMKSFRIGLGDRLSWQWDDRQEFSRLNSILLGLNHQKDDIVATYNARASMVNRKIFMGTDVPERLE